MPLPALVIEAVVVARVAVADMEPVFLGACHFMLANVLELNEITSNMIEHTVKYDLYSVLVERVTNLFQILVRSETAVYGLVINGIVTVSDALKKRSEIDSVAAQTFDMRDIVDKL